MIKVKGWLPIGSVVHIAGNDSLYLIIGCMQRQIDNGRLWDYLGVPYPLGLSDPNSTVLFDKDLIDKVLFINLQNSEGEKFQEFLASKEEEFQAAKTKSIDDIKASMVNEGVLAVDAGSAGVISAAAEGPAHEG